MNQQKDFSKEKRKFYKSDLYKNVKKRKKKLVNSLISIPQKQWQDVLPLTKVFREYETDDLVEFLNKVRDSDRVEYTIDDDPLCVTVINKNKKECSDFVCIEYFHLYSISEDESKIQRYSYFECYFDKYVLACIMDNSKLRNTNSFSAMNMDSTEWGRAKQQFQLWNGLLLPTIEELPAERNAYSVEMRERIKIYTEGKDLSFEKNINCPDVSDPLWMVVTYLHIFQMLPWIPDRSVPGYYLNFVCRNQTDSKLFAEKLKVFLSEYFENDPIIQGNIQLVQQFHEGKNLEANANGAIPYIVLPEKSKDIDRLRSTINEYIADNRGKQNHPFKHRIPICVSERSIVDSTALNILVDDYERLQWDCSVYNRVKATCSHIYGYSEMLEDSKSIQKTLKFASRMTLLQAELACLARGTSRNSWAQLIKHEGNYIKLAIWFRTLWKNTLNEDQTNEQAEWFGSMIEKLALKQKALDLVVEELMLRIKKEYEELSDERPLFTERLTAAEKKFRTTVDSRRTKKSVSLMCYHPDYFPEWLRAYALHIDTKSVLKRMDELGKLHREKQDRLTYGINLPMEKPKKDKSRMTVDYYSFPMK